MFMNKTYECIQIVHEELLSFSQPDSFSKEHIRSDDALLQSLRSKAFSIDLFTFKYVLSKSGIQTSDSVHRPITVVIRESDSSYSYYLGSSASLCICKEGSTTRYLISHFQLYDYGGNVFFYIFFYLTIEQT